MHESHNNLEAHVFICTKIKEDGKPCCGKLGGEKLRDQLKELTHDMGDHIKVTASGCLGKCKQGIAAVIYPEGLELTGLETSQAPELAEMLAKLYNE